MKYETANSSKHAIAAQPMRSQHRWMWTRVVAILKCLSY